MAPIVSLRNFTLIA